MPSDPYGLKLRGHISLREGVIELAGRSHPAVELKTYLEQKPPSYDEVYGPCPDDDQGRRTYSLGDQIFHMAPIVRDPFQTRLGGEQWGPEWSALETARAKIRQALWDGDCSAVVFGDGTVQSIPAEMWGKSCAIGWLTSGRDLAGEILLSQGGFEAWLNKRSVPLETSAEACALPSTRKFGPIAEKMEASKALMLEDLRSRNITTVDLLAIKEKVLAFKYGEVSRDTARRARVAAVSEFDAE